MSNHSAKVTTIFRGKTALVTGASSGLGADFARQLAAQGCHLILVARRLERLQELQAEISTRYEVKVDCVTIDLAVPDAPQQLYDQLKAAGQTVDILVNNAGHGLYGEFWQAPWAKLHQMLELDMVALTHLTHLFMADMVARDFGYILQVASTGAFQPTPTYAAYSAAKSYVLSLGEALHYELRRTHVTCTVLCPGVTRTEFFEVSGQRMTTYQRLTAMDSAEVARIGIAALLKGRSYVVAGWINAFFAWSIRFMPRRLVVASVNRLMT
jgi:short-subunit dehydrogenase